MLHEHVKGFEIIIVAEGFDVVFADSIGGRRSDVGRKVLAPRLQDAGRVSV